jgi:alkane 1-monooxygenase
MISSDTAALFKSALPYWVSFLLIPAVWFAAFAGNWWVLIIPALTWYLFTALDLIGGLNLQNVDLETTDEELKWYTLLTNLWVPAQVLTIFGLIYYVANTDHLITSGKIGLFFSVGVISGTLGIN